MSVCNKDQRVRPSNVTVKKTRLMKLALLSVREIQEAGLVDIVSSVCASALYSQVLFSPPSPPRAHHQGAPHLLPWWLSHPLFTDLAGDVHLHTPGRDLSPSRGQNKSLHMLQEQMK